MSRNPFGWSYPPGAENDPNAPWNQRDEPCEVCLKPIDNCICPECPKCGAVGDPKCYARGHLTLSDDQLASKEEGLRKAREIEELEDRYARQLEAEEERWSKDQ